MSLPEIKNVTDQQKSIAEILKTDPQSEEGKAVHTLLRLILDTQESFGEDFKAIVADAV